MPQTSQHDAVVKAFGVDTEDLGDRQVSVVISTGQIDRSGDVVVQSGINVNNFKASRTVLWNHDQDHPVAQCIEIGIKAGRLAAVVQFPPEGTTVKSDEVYRLVKAGVVNAASIGFLPLEMEPVDGKNPRKGLRIDESELLEFSFVSVPANPGAQVMQRALRASQPQRAKAVPPLTRKGLYAVSELAYLLQMLGYQVDSAFRERAAEGDTSTVPEQLKDAMNQLGSCLVAMTTEEVAELLAPGGDAVSDDMGDMGDAIYNAARFGLTKGTRLKGGRVISAANAATMRGHLAMIGAGHAEMVKMIDDACGEDEPADDDEPDQKNARAKRLRETEVLALQSV